MNEPRNFCFGISRHWLGRCISYGGKFLVALPKVKRLSSWFF